MDTLTGGLGPKEILALLITNIMAFLILLWILRRYAWGPLLMMIDARRDKIRSDYASAAKELEDAEKLRDQFDAKMADIKNIERERVQEAVKRGEGIAARLEDDARGKAGDFLSKAESELGREVTAARLDLRATTVDMAILAAEKVIQEKLDDKKHRRMIEDFIGELGEARG